MTNYINVPDLQAKVDERQKHWKEIVDKHFPKEGTDFTLFVLKAHLLIEQYLDALIIRHCGHPENYEHLHLRFKDKITLSKALMIFTVNEQVWESVGLINTMRNALAHKLDSPQLENYKANLKRLAKSVDYNIPKVDKDSDYGALYTLYAFSQLNIGIVETIIGPIMEHSRKQLREQLNKTFAPKK